MIWKHQKGRADLHNLFFHIWQKYKKDKSINLDIIYSVIHFAFQSQKSFYVSQDGLKVIILLPRPLVARTLSVHHCVHLRIFVFLTPNKSDSSHDAIKSWPSQGTAMALLCSLSGMSKRRTSLGVINNLENQELR